MDISAATTLAAGIVALVAPALIQTFKKYIPADYVGLTSLGVSVSCSASSPSPPPTASTATDGASSSPVSSASHRPCTRSSTKRSAASSEKTRLRHDSFVPVYTILKDDVHRHFRLLFRLSVIRAVAY